MRCMSIGRERYFRSLCIQSKNRIARWDGCVLSGIRDSLLEVNEPGFIYIPQSVTEVVRTCRRTSISSRSKVCSREMVVNVDGGPKTDESGENRGVGASGASSVLRQ